MTMTLDAPVTTREEETMPQTTNGGSIPAGDYDSDRTPSAGESSTVVVTGDTMPKQLAEVPTDTTAEAVMKPAEADAEDEFPVARPRTSGLPMVAFKPPKKDMSDYEASYAPPMSASPL